jgi:hypothetical protein
MVDPRDVWRIVTDAARLIAEGELVVFGSGALAFWLSDPPRSRDVDIWCLPKERSDAVSALMGELSWYHEKHGAYVEVWGPETFGAPSDWRTRAKTIVLDDLPKVRVVVPHPHDVLVAKLERMDPNDADHVERILKEQPLSAQALEGLASRAPAVSSNDSNRRLRFETNLRALVARLV